MNKTFIFDILDTTHTDRPYTTLLKDPIGICIGSDFIPFIDIIKRNTYLYIDYLDKLDVDKQKGSNPQHDRK